MARVYKIKSWDKHFENSRSRTIVDIDWVPVPNKHDGEGYRTIMGQPDGIVIYGCWHLILQVASKCHPRGTLVRDDGTPHTARSIAIKTSAREEDIQKSLDFVSSEAVGWIIIDEKRHSGGSRPSPTRHPGVTQPSLNRREGKGREENNNIAKTPEQPGSVAADSQDRVKKERSEKQKALDAVLKAFVTVKGIEPGPAWYKRHIRPASELLKEAGSADMAVMAIGDFAKYYDDKGIEWGLEAVLRRYPEWLKEAKGNGIHQ